MRKKTTRTLFAFAILLTLAIFTANAQTNSTASDTTGKIVVQVDEPGAKIDPMFYGLMTEEINYSYEGGLSGELIQNRIFRNPQGRGGRGRGRWAIQCRAIR